VGGGASCISSGHRTRGALRGNATALDAGGLRPGFRIGLTFDVGVKSLATIQGFLSDGTRAIYCRQRTLRRNNSGICYDNVLFSFYLGKV